MGQLTSVKYNADQVWTGTLLIVSSRVISNTNETVNRMILDFSVLLNGIIYCVVGAFGATVLWAIGRAAKQVRL